MVNRPSTNRNRRGVTLVNNPVNLPQSPPRIQSNIMFRLLTTFSWNFGLWIWGFTNCDEITWRGNCIFSFNRSTSAGVRLSVCRQVVRNLEMCRRKEVRPSHAAWRSASFFGITSSSSSSSSFWQLMPPTPTPFVVHRHRMTDENDSEH